MFETWSNLGDVNYKPGVIGPPSDAIANAIAVADGIWQSLGFSGVTVTSLRDSTLHAAGPCGHYAGNAADFRNRDLTPSQQQDAFTQLQQALPGYKVIWESNHFHVQTCGADVGSPIPSDPGAIDTGGDPGSIDTTGQSAGALDFSAGVTDFFASTSPLVLLGLGALALYLLRR